MYRKYLFFDLDGTLTDPMQGITRSVQYALRHFGIDEPDLRKLCPFIGPPLADSFRERYGMSDAEAAEAVAKYREYYAPKGIFENDIYPGIPELLAATAAAGCVNVMATSKPTPFAERIAEHFGFARYFRLVSGSTLDGTRTTKSDVIRHALGTLGIAPQEDDRRPPLRHRRSRRNGPRLDRRRMGIRRAGRTGSSPPRPLRPRHRNAPTAVDRTTLRSRLRFVSPLLSGRGNILLIFDKNKLFFKN